MQRYNPKQIEPKWQKTWEDSKIYQTPTPKNDNKYYCLVMFPYPSGNLHVGHWYNFGPADTVARYHRMLGRDVLHPIGFDAFGLPAENAAIQRGINPASWTDQNTQKMIEQLKSIGTIYDWEKLINTSKKDYYHWTQWIFLKLYENGLAYRKMGVVNWCPKDQTVLANEQVVGDENRCERCDTQVVQKELEQWYLKITDYAEELLESLEELDWPQRVKTMQKNWIGKSEGSLIKFEVVDFEESIEVFTTRADTIFGATFMVLAPEHHLIDKITTKDQKAEVQSYIDATAKRSEFDRQADNKEKTGVFSGAYAINPANNEKIPIWVGDFVLTSYGTGAIMAVPAHDQRDNDFAKKYEIPIVEVVESSEEEGLYSGEGLLINSGDYSGRVSNQAREDITADLKKRKKADFEVNYKLRDWLFGRQRYWGAPIPMIHCKECGIVPVTEDQLPVELPDSVKFEPTGKSPLIDNPDFVNVDCPKCDKPAQRETDTMDTFVDSSWYFLRYPNVNYEKGPFDPSAVQQWMPVDHYIGGVEHAILHLLYARFITKALDDHASLGFREPFSKLSNQGIILGPDGLKMSKSKGNVVDPDEQVASYGADSLRLYLMFMGPYDQGGPYDLGGIAGTRRFLERVWDLVDQFNSAAVIPSDDSEKALLLKQKTHQTVKKVTQDLEKMSFNTAIASLMALINFYNEIKNEYHLSSSDPVWKEALKTTLRLLAPMAPHISEELWMELHHDRSIHNSGWPTWDEKLVVEAFVTIVVQVNGKVRANLQVSRGSAESEVVKLAMADENVMNFVGNKQPKKVIFVKDRLVNFVV